MYIIKKETVILSTAETKTLTDAKNLLRDIYRDTSSDDLELLCERAEDYINSLLTEWAREE